ncbi:hypothetical protein FS837_010851 [Tulasnella sp. UAMH 9824]|nr:hypothetical protein FS837_010851 [Tulasnella sp. UAMH 9824]
MDFFKKAAKAVNDFQEQQQRQQQPHHDQPNLQADVANIGNRQQQPGQQPQPAQQLQPGQDNYDQDGPGPEIRLPPQLLEVLNKYVDTFHPGIAAGVTTEIQEFEQATIGALEQHVKQCIKGIFGGDDEEFQSNKNIQEFRAVRENNQQGANLPQYNYPSPDVVASREGGQLPEYGSRGLPFAGAASGAAITQQLSAAAGRNDQRQEPQHNKNVFASALGKVKNFAKDTIDDVGDDVKAGIKNMANTIDDITDHLDDKIDEIVPDLKEKVRKVLNDLHLGLAEKLTTAALAQVKRFLAGNISLGELGESALDTIGDVLGNFLRRDDKPQPGSRAISSNQDGKPAGGASGLLSEKLSSGLTHIRRNTRVDFRNFLSKIEEALFDSLPDFLREPLSKIFGGNPFAAKAVSKPQDDNDDGIFDDIGDKIREIFQRIQNAMRDRVLEIVSGGHRRLEDKAWGNVQDAIVNKVREYVPGVQVQLKD